MTTQLSTSTLYDRDYFLWLETTIADLREGKLAQIDYENLIEELEDMGNSQKSALESNLEQLLMHLLKWKYQPSRRSNSWQYSITEHCLRINKAFKKSPSLKRYFEEVFEECYQDARLLASRDTGLEKKTFPEICPFKVADVLDPEYLPD